LYQLNRSGEFCSFFSPIKIHVSPNDIVSSLFPSIAPPTTDVAHVAASCHTSLPMNQDELADFASFSSNASSRRLPSQAQTETLNLHHRHRPPSPNRLTHTLYCYKKTISALATLPTTQLRLHFVSSLARAPCHQSFTTIVILFHRRLTFIVPPHNDTHSDELADPHLFSE
jgi:hypothetical protein